MLSRVSGITILSLGVLVAVANREH
uniref:Uncharacterized protein n=1 Tax=Ralstonia solanacearum TaxID=305 RepID=A0A0S4U096_RALSL|nr:protein of unknown function [Ralstonia solanacearum]